MMAKQNKTEKDTKKTVKKTSKEGTLQAQKKVSESKSVKKVESAKAKKTEKNAKNAQKSVKSAKNASKKKKIEEKSWKEFQLLGFHDLPLACFVFDKVQNPKAVVVIVHGMMEHCLRYQKFAEFLNAKGFVVVATDLRGHGRTMQTPDDYGKGEQDIFRETLQDQLLVINHVKQTFKLPVFLFGHSYGSMLTQHLIQLTPIVEKAVLCGTADGGTMLFWAASTLTSLVSPFANKNKRGGIAEKLCIQNFGKKFERGNWFTRDEKEFDKYFSDQFCGGSFPFSFYKSMVKNLRKANKNIGKIGNKKVFLIAGSEDPVGSKGKSVRSLYKRYLKNNVDAKLKIYEGARHELVNETNRQEVWQDVANFFED